MELLELLEELDPEAGAGRQVTVIFGISSRPVEISPPKTIIEPVIVIAVVPVPSVAVHVTGDRL